MSFCLHSELVKRSCALRLCEQLRTNTDLRCVYFLFSRRQRWGVFNVLKLPISENKGCGSGKLSENRKKELKCSPPYAFEICQYQRQSKKMQIKDKNIFLRPGQNWAFFVVVVEISDIKHETKERIQITVTYIVCAKVGSKETVYSFGNIQTWQLNKVDIFQIISWIFLSEI